MVLFPPPTKDGSISRSILEYLLSAREQRSFLICTNFEILKEKKIQDLLTHRQQTAVLKVNTSNFMMAQILKTMHCCQIIIQSFLSFCIWMISKCVIHLAYQEKKNHRITAVCSVLANVPPLLRSSLTSIYLHSQKA